MLEVIYRIYEVSDTETAMQNVSMFFKADREVLMDCIVCENRDAFKDIIRDRYRNIPFRNTKKLQAGDLYCIIIGEHCYNTERYFSEIKFKCDYCGAEVRTFDFAHGKMVLSNHDVTHYLCGLEEYRSKHFCSSSCRSNYLDREMHKLRPDCEQEFWVTKDMFSDKIAGYIYKISKKSTGEFYVGQTKYLPVFRWAQHLKTERFPSVDIVDYKFEVIEIVPLNTNILEREKFWIQKLYKECPEKSLNISCTKGVIV